jgi:hypothetical protein
MSYSVHRRSLTDVAIPIEQRASHARSCALHVAQKLGVKRSVVIAHVAARTGVDLDNLEDDDSLARAFTCIDALRLGSEMLMA